MTIESRSHSMDCPYHRNFHLARKLRMSLNCGSSAFVVPSTKEKAARAGLGRQHTATQCVRDDFGGGNIPQCRSALVSWWINTMAEHDKCGRAGTVDVTSRNLKKRSPRMGLSMDGSAYGIRCGLFIIVR